MTITKAELISTTNVRFAYMCGQQGDLVYKIGYSANFASPSNIGIFHTSVVEDITYEQSDDDEKRFIVLTTMNSTYVFKEL